MTEIENSPNDWGYMTRKNGRLRRVWAIPSLRENHYDIYFMDGAFQEGGKVYLIEELEVCGCDVENKMLKILEEKIW